MNIRPEILDAVDDYRFARRTKSRTLAVEELLIIGLLQSGFKLKTAPRPEPPPIALPPGQIIENGVMINLPDDDDDAPGAR